MERKIKRIIVLSMEKYVLDYSKTSYFKGLRILYPYIQEGLLYAKQNNIKDICVWTQGDWTKQNVIFDFLNGKSFIETFHWLVPMSKKTDVTGIYNLFNLKELRWGSYDLDLSYFKELERLNITYSAKILGWNSLKKVTHLTIGGVKTEDLSFLEDMENLEYLRIIKGTFSTIKGIERCNKLKTIFIQGCNSLLEIKDTLIKNKSIENLLLERCKNVILEDIESLGLKNLSVI